VPSRLVSAPLIRNEFPEKYVLASLPGNMSAPVIGGTVVRLTMTWIVRVALPALPVATRISRLLVSAVAEASLATPVTRLSPLR
jgi:hypothetical protein